MYMITVRTATPTDADVIVAHNIAMARETENRLLDPETVRAGVRNALTDSNRGVYYLAERDGNVVGQLLITREWSDWRNAWLWWIQSVFVAAAARKIGVYRALHEHVANLARRRQDVCGLRLYVAQSNETAKLAYLRLAMHPSNYIIYETDWSGT